jgi:hypothetical protein
MVILICKVKYAAGRNTLEAALAVERAKLCAPAIPHLE